MYLRIVKGTVQAGQIDEFARRWETGVGSRIKQMPGFRHAYLVTNRDTNAVAGVTMWDTLPDVEMTKQAIQAFQEQVADITTGSPSLDDFEVVVEL